ncbi:MAG: hypothetical protein ACLUSK_02755 [Bacteroides stercoris]
MSRIENGQYTETEDVSVDEVLDELLPDLMDIYEAEEGASCYVQREKNLS